MTKPNGNIELDADLSTYYVKTLTSHLELVQIKKENKVCLVRNCDGNGMYCAYIDYPKVDDFSKNTPLYKYEEKYNSDGSFGGITYQVNGKLVTEQEMKKYEQSIRSVISYEKYDCNTLFIVTPDKIKEIICDKKKSKVE